MRHNHRQGQLFINGHAVGEVVAESASEGWGFGQFKPSDEFSQFAPVFGAWAMLLHEDDDRDRPSDEALEELGKVETAMDRLKAELVWTDSQQRMPLRQLTIDGTLIEWSH